MYPDAVLGRSDRMNPLSKVYAEGVMFLHLISLHLLSLHLRL